jgi:hypothetical protein
VGIICLQRPAANGRKLRIDQGGGDLSKPVTAMGGENEDIGEMGGCGVG